ncbi:hypothetical protein QYF36_009140 [Acer negundo]|nr:hypothetical protein QYF36_009140 [Acer negundo]
MKGKENLVYEPSNDCERFFKGYIKMLDCLRPDDPHQNIKLLTHLGFIKEIELGISANVHGIGGEEVLVEVRDGRVFLAFGQSYECYTGNFAMPKNVNVNLYEIHCSIHNGVLYVVVPKIKWQPNGWKSWFCRDSHSHFRALQSYLHNIHGPDRRSKTLFHL